MYKGASYVEKQRSKRGVVLRQKRAHRRVGRLVWLSRVDESKGSRWRHTQGSQVLMRTLAFSLLSEV